MFDDSRAERSSPETPAATTDIADARFHTCRWRNGTDGGVAYCQHGEVLPYAGRNGFNPQAWCADCAFYKKARRRNRPEGT